MPTGQKSHFERRGVYHLVHIGPTNATTLVTHNPAVIGKALLRRLLISMSIYIFSILVIFYIYIPHFRVCCTGSLFKLLEVLGS